jgi:putative hydrolase of the HAD superfamily
VVGIDSFGWLSSALNRVIEGISPPQPLTTLHVLPETLLDRAGSLHDFVTWQAQEMLRSSVKDENEFCRRFIELDSNGTVWKDQVYSTLVQEFNITDWSVSELLSSYELCLSGFCKLILDASNALKALHKNGYRLGVVSNGRSPFQERNFNALGVGDLFGAVVVSEAVGFRKPEPEIFQIACNALDTTRKGYICW